MCSSDLFVWVILWGLLLRWLLFARMRMGLNRDIAALVSRLPAARLVDPLLADFAAAAEKTKGFIERCDQLGGQSAALSARLTDSAAGLGRLRGETSDGPPEGAA